MSLNISNIVSTGNAKKIHSLASFCGTKNPRSEAELKVFHHHIYEYKKGLRALILTTEKEQNRSIIENRLRREGIAYIICNLEKESKKINVFFGDETCVEVVKMFGENLKNLSKLTPEQDFILGIMLGYSRVKQCTRYITMKMREAAH